MAYFRFEENEVIHNTVVTHPESSFYLFKTTAGSKSRLIYNNSRNPIVEDSVATTYDQSNELSAPNTSHVPYGFVELFGQNVARPYSVSKAEQDFIYPFITKDSGLSSMSTVSTSEFNTEYAYGDEIKGLGVRGATISSQYISSGTSSLDPNGRKRDALRSTFSYYVRYSPRFSYEKGLANLDVSSSSWEQESVRMIQIPSIFYGEKIKKGTVKLDWYNKGRLIATVEDSKQNGELIVVHSLNQTEIGKFVGLIFYREGFLLLTNRSKIYSNSQGHVDIMSDGHFETDVSWIDYMSPLENYTINSINLNEHNWDADASCYHDPVDPNVVIDPAVDARSGSQYSYNLYFKGTHSIPTLTMLANLEKAEGSHSNNPTFIDSDYAFSDLKLKKAANVQDYEQIINVVEGNETALEIILEEDHGLRSALNGDFVKVRILNLFYPGSSSDPFAGLDLYVKVMGSKRLRLYRVDDSSAYVPVRTPPANHEELQPSANTRVSVIKSSYERFKPSKGKYGYIESNSFKIKNTVKSEYDDPYAEYEDHTYISQIGLYDEDKNLIGIAKLATPVKKTPDRDYTFKIKIDI